jgi:hypothetical protein
MAKTPFLMHIYAFFRLVSENLGLVRFKTAKKIRCRFKYNATILAYVLLPINVEINRAILIIWNYSKITFFYHEIC